MRSRDRLVEIFEDVAPPLDLNVDECRKLRTVRPDGWPEGPPSGGYDSDRRKVVDAFM